MRQIFISITLFLFTLFYLGVETSDAGFVDESIAAHLQTYVAGQLSIDPSEIEVTRLKPINGQRQLLPGEIVKTRPAVAKKLLGRVVFVLTVRQSGGPPFEQWISAGVVRIQEAIVAKRMLRRHQVIDAEDLEIQKIRIKRQGVQLETDREALLGKRLIRSVKKGDAIQARFVEEAPVILRGDSIIISLESPGLKITTIGKAKEDGLQGDLIRVINLDSRKIVFGKVIAPGRVSVGPMARE